MPLAAGSSIGPYDIVGLIGTGGMGEVYRARDRKLHREIALKILPEPFASDAERLTRFEREARALAALNHPHIAQIYGVEESIGGRALVMELVEGETLAERTARGALPVPETVAITRQIADALDSAHERGIIHRDLKPANIMLRPDGTAKVLDFGLAKAFDSRSDGDAAQSPTVTAAGTRVGTILGTAAYMSPEQARGLAADKRTDIWAVGCVLYEMLTGRAAFAGGTVSDTVARILEREPDWSRLPRDTPPAIRRLVRRCLEKDVRRRMRDLGDARIELEEAYASAPEQAAEPRPKRRAVVGWAVTVGAVTLVLGFLAGMTWRDTRRTPPEPGRDLVRFTVPVPPGELFAVDQSAPPALAISPGGERIAYVMRGRDGDRLYLRQRGDPVPVPLAGTEGASGPFFSPDGQWIGFASGGTLMKMAVDGGAPSALAPAPNFAGAAWGDDGTIIYSPSWRSALSTVSAGGGTPRPLTTLDGERGEVEHVAPHLLPGGRHVLLAVGTGEPQTRAVTGQQIALLDLATGQRRILTEGSNPHYLASGHVVFARGEAVFGAPFDAGRLELTGPPVRVLDGIRTDGNDTQFALASDGTLAFISSGSAHADRRLVRVDRKGQPRLFTEDRASFIHPRISPDGQHVVVQAAGEFLVYDVERGTRSRIRAKGSRPIWMPDGRSILFHAQGRLYAAPVDDTSEPHLVLAPKQGFAFPLAWSKDGRVLLYSNPVPGANRSRDVWVLPSGGEPRPLLTTGRDERSAMFSPDGRWIVYAEKDVGREEEVYAQPYPGPGPRQIVSRGGGIEPVWSPTGREIFYRSIDGRRLMAVAVRIQPSFSAGTPQMLFEGPYPLGSTYWSDYDVWPGGQEFLLIASGAVTSPELHVVVNWTVLQRLPGSE